MSPQPRRLTAKLADRSGKPLAGSLKAHAVAPSDLLQGQAVEVVQADRLAVMLAQAGQEGNGAGQEDRQGDL